MLEVLCGTSVLRWKPDIMSVDSITRLMLAAGALSAELKEAIWVLHEEISSPAALNYLNKSSSGLYRQPRKTGKV